MKQLTLLLILSVVGGVRPQSSVAFCDLLRNPAQYDGKEVRVRATYRYGFEWSQLYCIDCIDKGKAWLKFSDNLDEASQRSLRKLPKGAGIANLTVQGVFSSVGTFGHSNGYRYQILASKISDVSVIQKGMQAPEMEQKAENRWACGGTNPK